ncbi:MAG: sugar-binding domain-containing protein, partial [Rubripirellula sp.]
MSIVGLVSGFVLALLGSAVAKSPLDERGIDLSGSWQVRLDPSHRFDPASSITTVPSDPLPAFVPVDLPGALRDSGLGDPVGPDTTWIGEERASVLKSSRFQTYTQPGNFKSPFWLQPDRHYVGLAWYQRKIDIPSTWVGTRILLHLERPHWISQVFIDGQRVGTDDSLGTPHQYDITSLASSGSHTLSIGIDNSLTTTNVGKNAHSVTDHTQTAWHGIVGDIKLLSRPMLSVLRSQVVDRKNEKQCDVNLVFNNSLASSQPVTVNYRIHQDSKLIAQASIDHVIESGPSINVNATIPWKTLPRRWDEFDPAMCQLTVDVVHPSSRHPWEYTCDFGIRHLNVADHQFVLNDRPIFLRGTLESCVFPISGYPPTDLDAWIRIMRICKQHGLNHIRFHSWCPPDSAFVAADRA